MAGRGPAPKQTRSRKRDAERRDAEVAEIVDAGVLHGPPLPDDVLPDGQQWHPQTVALWDALRRSALLADETDLGWQFLVDTALMHHTMWSKGRWEFASEVRLRVAKFGATPEDRMRLKVRVTKPEPTPGGAGKAAGSAGVTNIASRRARLTEQREG